MPPDGGSKPHYFETEIGPQTLVCRLGNGRRSQPHKLRLKGRTLKKAQRDHQKQDDNCESRRDPTAPSPAGLCGGRFLFRFHVIGTKHRLSAEVVRYSLSQATDERDKELLSAVEKAVNAPPEVPFIINMSMLREE